MQQGRFHERLGKDRGLGHSVHWSPLRKQIKVAMGFPPSYRSEHIQNRFLQTVSITGNQSLPQADCVYYIGMVFGKAQTVCIYLIGLNIDRRFV